MGGSQTERGIESDDRVFGYIDEPEIDEDPEMQDRIIRYS